ncbi:hypothetical protein Aca07nite_60830 [Actinoplanes capillaceus]|uniref:Uncharacterized protein n=1 Tax=Actinoplanes campanulatus TaxID=113559 RepID=A0ABQ3WR91_9ACTN|nr:hypothetical protein Aca07nite_60830 [Actinoplanes capillaceus]
MGKRKIVGISGHAEKLAHPAPDSVPGFPLSKIRFPRGPIGEGSDLLHGLVAHVTLTGT